jgi:NIPSNAP
MNIRSLPIVSLLGLALFGAASLSAQESPVFELRTYTAAPGKHANVLARFRDHTVKLFEKHGMTNLGYAVPMDAKDGAGEKLVYLLQHKSRDAAKASFKAFGADPAWKAVKEASEKDGKIVASIESVFLTQAEFSPKIDDYQGPPRVFEMRTYTTPPGKVAAIDARFRDHTIALFSKHGMTHLGYYHPTDAEKGAGSTLIYFLAHKDREAAAKSFAAFRLDPAWIAARAASEKAAGGPLTVKDGVKSVFLVPTDFSPIK